MSKDDDGTDGPSKPFVLKDLSELESSVSAEELESAHRAMAVERERAVDTVLGRGSATQRLADMAMALSGSSHLKKITDELMDQERNIGKLTGAAGTAFDRSTSQVPYSVPSLPPIPQNPLLETNRRLARIEGQFEVMQTIAAQGAKIATSLQTYAAEFLAKFEAAAASTEQSANKAVRLSVAAIILTVATALAPFVYQVWRAPADAAANEAVVAQLRAEIEQLRETQAETADRIEDALTGNGEATLEVLREMQRSIATSIGVPEAPTRPFNPTPR